MKAACSSGLSFGGGVVLVATFTPSSIKKFSEPAGEQMHRRRAALEELLWNWCGAFERMLMLSPALTMDFFPRRVTSTSPSSRMNVSSKSWRCGPGPPPGGTCMSMTQKRPLVSSPVTVMVRFHPNQREPDKLRPGMSVTPKVRLD